MEDNDSQYPSFAGLMPILSVVTRIGAVMLLCVGAALVYAVFRRVR